MKYIEYLNSDSKLSEMDLQFKDFSRIRKKAEDIMQKADTLHINNSKFPKSVFYKTQDKVVNLDLKFNAERGYHTTVHNVRIGRKNGIEFNYDEHGRYDSFTSYITDISKERNNYNSYGNFMKSKENTPSRPFVNPEQRNKIINTLIQCAGIKQVRDYIEYVRYISKIKNISYILSSAKNSYAFFEYFPKFKDNPELTKLLKKNKFWFGFDGCSIRNKVRKKTEDDYSSDENPKGKDFNFKNRVDFIENWTFDEDKLQVLNLYLNSVKNFEKELDKMDKNLDKYSELLNTLQNDYLFVNL